jgi:hypothetical protein
MLVKNQFRSAMLYKWLPVTSCFEFWRPIVCQGFWVVIVYQPVDYELCSDFQNKQSTPVHPHCQVRCSILSWCYLNVFCSATKHCLSFEMLPSAPKMLPNRTSARVYWTSISLAKHWITKHSIHRFTFHLNWNGRTIFFAWAQVTLAMDGTEVVSEKSNELLVESEVVTHQRKVMLGCDPSAETHQREC